MKYVFITWKPHITETFLLEEFLIILKPLLYKRDTYMLSLEKAGTPAQHYHVVLSFPDSADNSNLIIFEKCWIQLKKSIIDRKLSTLWEKAYHSQFVKKTEHDFHKLIGYGAKEGYSIMDSKGLTDEFVTDCVKYYYQVTRKSNGDESQKPQYIILNGKNYHTYTHHFCQKYGISLKDKMLTSKLAHFGISYDNIGTKQIVRGLAMMNLKEYEENPNHLDEYEILCYEKDLDQNITEDTESEKFKYHMSKYKLTLVELYASQEENNKLQKEIKLLKKKHTERVKQLELWLSLSNETVEKKNIEIDNNINDENNNDNWNK
jgi:hypothetical protein